MSDVKFGPVLNVTEQPEWMHYDDVEQYTINGNVCLNSKARRCKFHLRPVI